MQEIEESWVAETYIPSGGSTSLFSSNSGPDLPVSYNLIEIFRPFILSWPIHQEPSLLTTPPSEPFPHASTSAFCSGYFTCH
jgi:hypothetical protein